MAYCKHTRGKLNQFLFKPEIVGTGKNTRVFYHKKQQETDKQNSLYEPISQSSETSINDP